MSPALLDGIRVVDLTRVLAGPFATQTLGDMGADVIKVEDVRGGDGVRSIPPYYPGGESHYFLALNRNKRSIALDLKAPEGRQAVLDLVATADVVIENFRPGVMDRLGLGFEDLTSVKPDLIMCSISGYGMDGPLVAAPAFDLVVQARSGAMHINGDPDRPPTKMGLPIGDLGGGMWATIAILAALNRRHADPQPQHLDVSLLDGLIGLHGYLTQLALLTGASPERMGSDHHNVVPYGRFKAKDGYLVVAVLVGPFWARLCRAIDRPDLIDDERFADGGARREHRDELLELLDSIFVERTREDWERILTEHDVPHGPVLDVVEALEQEQVAARGLIRTLQHPSAGDIRVVGSPLRVNGAPVAPATRAAPLLGEQTRSIATELLGMEPAQVDELVQRGVFAEPATPEPTAPPTAAQLAAPEPAAAEPAGVPDNVKVDQ